MLEAYEAEILLHHCKWNKDRLLHLSSSDYKLTSLLAEAGLTCSEDVPLASSSENGCPVCLRPLLEPLSLDCNHNCCRVRIYVLTVTMSYLEYMFWRGEAINYALACAYA